MNYCILLMATIAFTKMMKSTTAEYFSNHNFGYRLRKLGKIQLTAGHTRMVFHTKMPEIPPARTEQLLNCSMFRIQSQRQKCHSYRHLVNCLHALKVEAMNILRKRVHEMSTLLNHVPQNDTSRQKRGIISNAIYHYLGIASSEDLDLVKHMLKK